MPDIVCQVDARRSAVVPPQMAKYAQILAGKHWRDVLGEDGLLRREASSAASLPAAAPHNAWQAGPLPNDLLLGQRQENWGMIGDKQEAVNSAQADPCVGTLSALVVHRSVANTSREPAQAAQKGKLWMHVFYASL